MESRSCSHPAQQPIRPVVYGIGFYFLIAATDSFQIGTIGSLLKIAAFLPLLLLLFDVRSLKLRFSPLMILQLLFWLLTVFSFFYSVGVDRTLASVETLTLNLLLILCLGVLEEYNDRELQLMKTCLLLGGWVTIALTLVFSDFSLHGRMTLLLGQDSQDQNYINGYFLYAFAHHCSQMLLQRKKIHILPTVVILIIVLLTGSRGALIAFSSVIFTCVCIQFAKSEHKIRNISLIALLIILFFILLDLVLAQMPQDVSQRFTWDYIAEKGSTGRTKIWDTLIRHYSTDSIPRMLFGHGYGTTPIINTRNHLVAHNLYLDNLITLGTTGLLLQLLSQATILRILHRNKQYALFVAYIGMLFMCLSLSLMAYKPIWNIMLLALVIDTKSKSHASETLYSGKTQEVHL